MTPPLNKPIFLSGATGFIGSQLYPRLIDQGYDVRCGTRSPNRAKQRFPDRKWVRFDVEDPESLPLALRDCSAAFYLIHQMATGGGYVEREKRSAIAFSDAASRAGLERIVYLGGVAPSGTPSKHLKSRLQTGRALRAGGVPCLELRASMIIGAESESWQIVRDLAARLPVMLLPSWTASRTEPLAIDDVLVALTAALDLDLDGPRRFDLPGPEIMTVEEILSRTASLLGHNTRRYRIPLLTPKLSSYWLRFITAADYSVARELVTGLKTDLLAADDAYWSLIDHRDLVPFDTAASQAIAEGGPSSAAGRLVERFLGVTTQ